MARQEDSSEKIEEAQKKYWASEKGKEVQRKYNLSPKGREAKMRYLESEKGKAALLRYYLSEKGHKTRGLQIQLKKLLAQCGKFLEENPDKTPEDFLIQLEKEEQNGTNKKA